MLESVIHSGKPGEQRSPDQALEIAVGDLLSPIRFREVFWNDLPLEVDLGSGPGKFIVDAAKSFPNRNFLGVERLLGRVRKTRRRAYQLGIVNLRILRMEMEYAVKYLFPRQSVSRFHLSFPDPWPKRRHQTRRVADREFFEALWCALMPDGEVRIKTDHEDYFKQIVRVAADSALWNFLPWIDDGYPVTDFEQEFLAKNSPIYRLRVGRRIAAPQKV